MRALVIILICLTNHIIRAQTHKGSWLIGGNMTARYDLKASPNALRLDFKPNAGYFVSNNFVLGLTLPIDLSSQKSTSSAGIIGFPDGQPVEISKITESSLGIAPFIRGYLGSSKWRPFLEAQAGYLRQSYKITYRTLPERREIRTSGFVEGGVGVNYFLSEMVGLEALLSGSYHEQVNSPFPSTGIGLYFGVQFFLPHK